MKVCPYYNRGQCDQTEENSEKLFCVKHNFVPFTEETVKNNEPENCSESDLDMTEVPQGSSATDSGKERDNDTEKCIGLKCSRGHSFEKDRLGQYKNSDNGYVCWCGSKFLASVPVDIIKDIDKFHELNERTVGAMEPTKTNKESVGATTIDKRIEFSIICNGEKFDSFSKSAIIGRDECFDEGLRKILLEQVGVSRRHLKIEKRSDNEFFVSDLESSNGTLANNKKVYSAGITLESPITIELGEPGGTGIKIEVNND